MIHRKIYLFLVLLLTFIFLFVAGGRTQSFSPYKRGTPPKPGTQAPVITHAYAADKGRYGTIWEIYIEAEDTDADMDYVAVVVNQPGIGGYPTDYILLDPQHRNHFKGFLQWNTFSSKGGALEEGTRITLRVSIIDKAGNESNEVIFPFTFELTPGQYQYQLPPPFDQGDLVKLGNIMIDLYPSDMPGGNGGSGTPN